VAWDIKLVPSIAASSLAQLLFYPAITWSDVGTAPTFREWASSTAPLQLARSLLYVAGFAVSAAASLWLLLKPKGHVFESSLATTTRVAEKRVRLQQGRRVAVLENLKLRSARLPKRALFRGVGAIVWKNLVVARRSKRELALAFVFTLVFTTPLTAMLWMHHDFVSKGIETSRQDAEEFHTGIALMLGFLAFLLQRTFPFDFRCDGHHLVGFRTLPVSPFALALAEIAVPTGLCLAFQALGIAALMIFARSHWATMLLVLLAYPAIALAVMRFNATAKMANDVIRFVICFALCFDFASCGVVPPCVKSPTFRAAFLRCHTHQTIDIQHSLLVKILGYSLQGIPVSGPACRPGAFPSSGYST